MAEAKARDTRQDAAFTEGGYTVVPRMIYDLPQRLRYVYFELSGLAVYTPYLHKESGLTLQPGQCLYTYSFIANRCGVTYEQARGAIRELAGLGLLEFARQCNRILITIRNYREMQDLKSYASCNNFHTQNHTLITSQSIDSKDTCGESAQTNHTPNHTNKNSKREEQQKKTPLPPKGVCEEFVALWNSICGEKLPKVAKLTSGRKKKILARLKENPLEWWKIVFAKALEDPFYLGGGERGWKCDLDYFIRNDTNGQKVYEKHTPAIAEQRMTTCALCNGDGVWREVECPKCNGTGKRPA